MNTEALKDWLRKLNEFRKRTVEAERISTEIDGVCKKLNKEIVPESVLTDILDRLIRTIIGHEIAGRAFLKSCRENEEPEESISVYSKNISDTDRQLNIVKADLVAVIKSKKKAIMAIA